MLKRMFVSRPGSLAVTLGVALVFTLTPALTRPSFAGAGPVYWPQPWPQQWPQQWSPQGVPQWPQQQSPQPWPQQGTPQPPQQSTPQPWPAQWSQAGPQRWPLGGPDEWRQQNWYLYPIDTLLHGLTHLYPHDISVADWNGGPLLLWRDYPVTIVDVRSILYDDEIDFLLDEIDYDPLAADNADGLTAFLQDEEVLPEDVGVVGLDLLDGPPALFVLPF
jgi:hypothetical protein